MEIEPYKATIILLIAFLIIGISYSVYINYIKISSQGIIKTINLKAYQDSACTIPLTKIDWGTLTPDTIATYNIYLLNDGNTNTTLTMTTEDWNPSNAINYISLTWDAEGKTLEPNKPLQVTFTLTISKDIERINSFSFYIIILAS
ncbi:MAG: hypothetical protein QW270_06690 [Candidatus Bathyarchaeia archaeon]